MTCIVGLECDSGVMVGCDSWFGTRDLSDRIDRPKWIIRGPVLIACAGDLRPMQLLNFSPRWRNCHPRENTGDYVSNVIAKALADAVGQTKYDATFMVAMRGKVYYMDESMMVARSKYGYASIGIADTSALASLAATESITNPEERVMKVLRSVARHHPSVTPDFHVLLHK